MARSALGLLHCALNGNSLLRTAYAAAEDKAKLAAIARKSRDVLLLTAYNYMRNYREVIPGPFAASSNIVQTLPHLPGATRKAVTNILWQWKTDTLMARKSWRLMAKERR